jgi:PKD domain
VRTTSAIGALLAALVFTAGAEAAVTAPDFRPPAFAKGFRSGGVVVTLRWAPATFSPQTALDRIDIVLRNETRPDASPPPVLDLPRDSAQLPVVLIEGHAYTITIQACQSAGPCSLRPPGAVWSSTGTLRADDIAPTGSLQINGGRPFTNSLDVTLNFSAADPEPGTGGIASGVSQVALDLDGDGVYPCSNVFPPPPDNSGCARPFTAAIPLTLRPVEGVHTVGATFGDGARDVEPPCTLPFCVPTLDFRLLGNPSASVQGTVVVDTERPTARVFQSRVSLERGDAVLFDASRSVDSDKNVPSGVDLPASTWDFRDGAPRITGAKATHVYQRVGTFAGELQVRDRAGNASDPQTFSVTVTPGPGDAGAVGAVTGGPGARFRIDALRVRARYVRSRLKGSIVITGSSTQAGPLRVTVKRRGGRSVSRRTSLPAGAFIRSVALPARLLPGRYALGFSGPGGTLRAPLRLLPPREGVLRSARLTRSAHGVRATFTFARQPVPSLRRRLTVAWARDGRALPATAVRPGRRVVATAPATVNGATGRLRATLRAGNTTVGSAALTGR